MIHLRQSYDPKNSRIAIELTNLTGADISNPVFNFITCTFVRPNSQSENVKIIKNDGTNYLLEPRTDWIWPDGETWSFDVAVLLGAHSWQDGVMDARVVEGDQSHAVTVSTLRNHHVDHSDSSRPNIADLATSARPELPLIPWPNSVDISTWKASKGIDPSDLSADQQKQFYNVQALVSRLFPNLINPLLDCENARKLKSTKVDLPTESYKIIFDDASITIEHGDESGLHYALITIAQIYVGAESGEYEIPRRGQISDAPRFGWRGSMLDVSRHFMKEKDVLRYIDLMAWNKFNRFHWHLTDDEGWRIESRKFPELNKIGSWRGPNEKLAAQYSHIDERYGGYYTFEQIKKIVAHAIDLHIETMPEIDIPGHCKAVIASMPHLVDPEEKEDYYISVQNHFNNALNPSIPEVYEVLTQIIDEIAPLFPFMYVHLGGDEVSRSAWMKSPKARAMMENTQGIQKTSELQSHFLREMQSYLHASGKKMGAWDEASHGGGVERKGTLLFAWQSREKVTELLESGYNVVATPGQRYYMDMCQSSGWNEAGAFWTEGSDVVQTYDYDPSLDGDDHPSLVGVQAGIWTELIYTREFFNHMVFPRHYAVAEGAWTAKSEKNFERFAHCCALMPEL